MLTKDILFGMNVLSLVGFVVMGIGLNLNRTRKIRPAFAVALMSVGTVLVFAGLYTLPRSS